MQNPKRPFIIVGTKADKSSIAVGQLKRPTQRLFPCAQCGLSFKNNQDLNSHIYETHIGQEIYHCDICDIYFSHAKQLKAHSEKTHPRNISTNVVTLPVVGQHVRSAKGIHGIGIKPRKDQPPFLGDDNCNDMNDEIGVQGIAQGNSVVQDKGVKVQKSKTSQHTNQAAKTKKKHPCKKCGKEFSTPKLLKRHSGTHRQNGPTPCIVCGKVLYSKPGLDRHMFIHSGDQPFKCEQCGKKFGVPSHLKRHMISHTGEKSLECNVCGKMLAASGGLARHMLIHTGEKPYVCKICGQGFVRSFTLKIHEAKHTGEKPFSCEQCGKSFICNLYLQKHMVVRHSEKEKK